MAEPTDSATAVPATAGVMAAATRVAEAAAEAAEATDGLGPGHARRQHAGGADPSAYSTNTSSRFLRMAGSSTMISSTTATASSAALSGRSTKTIGSPCA